CVQLKGISAALLLAQLICVEILRLQLAVFGRKHSSGVLPKPERDRHGIDVDAAPPCGLVPLAVELAMVDPAKRNRELIRDSAAERARLRKPNVVSFARLAPAHSARLAGNETDVILVATATWFH